MINREQLVDPKHDKGKHVEGDEIAMMIDNALKKGIGNNTIIIGPQQPLCDNQRRNGDNENAKEDASKHA